MSGMNASATQKLLCIGIQPVLASGVLVVVMLFGLWQMLGAIRTMDMSDVPKGWDNFWTGRITQTLEKRLDHALPARAELIMVANAISYGLTGGAGADVRAGRGNWLFLTDELRVGPTAASELEKNLQRIVEMHHRLQARGVAMTVLLVPDKARVHAEALRAARVGIVERRYALALESLRGKGVPVIDLFDDMQTARRREPERDLYYRTDTHWNEAGAELAAMSVTRWSSQHFPLAGGERYQVRHNDRDEERVGDLLALMGLEHAPAWLRPAGDWEAASVIEPLIGAGADDLDALFADAAVPVVLLGTSYSQRANFPGFLQLHLASKVLNAAKDGGGITGSAQDYFADESFRLSPPQLIVWEVPERFLTQPSDIPADWAQHVLSGR